MLAFGVFGRVLVGVSAVNALVSRFGAFDGCALFGDSLRRCARAVRDGCASEGVPLPYYVLMRAGAVLPTISHIKNIISKTWVI